jgi:uncharacterized protein (DUF1697 family)
VPEWVSLLRGINLGSHNKVNMPRLREALAEAGFAEIRTYVQSGNIVADSSHRKPETVAVAVHGVVLTTFGVKAPVVVRTPDQMRAVVAWCPFAEEAKQRPTAVHVLHLTAVPDPGRAAAALDTDWGPDQLVIDGTEAAICYAETMHDSRLQHATLLKRLGVDGTARNWRTVEAITQLLRT